MSANQSVAPQQPLKFLDLVRQAIRLRGLSYRTEKAYVDWSKRYILYHQKRHPQELGAPEIQPIFHFPYAIYHLSLKRTRSASK